MTKVEKITRALNVRGIELLAIKASRRPGEMIVLCDTGSGTQNFVCWRTSDGVDTEHGFYSVDRKMAETWFAERE
jgi:hypothetical protein